MTNVTTLTSFLGLFRTSNTAQSTDNSKGLGYSFNKERYGKSSLNSYEVVQNCMLKQLLLSAAQRASHSMQHKMKVGKVTLLIY